MIQNLLLAVLFTVWCIHGKYLYIFQINIVAGGQAGYGSYLDSVELNVAGERGWTYGSPLPKPLNGPRGVTVMSQFYLTGQLQHKYCGHFMINCLCCKEEYTRRVMIPSEQMSFNCSKNMDGQL